MLKPKVSVVIPAFNEEQYLADCIQSVRNQKTSFLFEIIVVDNGSLDKTAEIAEREGAIVIAEKKKGLSHARKTGLKNAKGEILVYFDADTKIPHGWLQTVVDYLENHPDVVGVSGNFRYYDGRFIDSLSLLFFQKVVVPPLLLVLRLFGKPDVFFGPNMVCRTEALKKAGGILENLEFYGEDAGIAKQLSTQGKVRLLQQMYVQTSARRMKEKNAFKTILLYFTSFLLLQFGNVRKVSEFSKEHTY